MLCWHQIITRTNVDLFYQLSHDFNKILFETDGFSLKKMHLKMLSAKYQQLHSGPKALALNVQWLN